LSGLILPGILGGDIDILNLSRRIWTAGPQVIDFLVKKRKGKKFKRESQYIKFRLVILVWTGSAGGAGAEFFSKKKKTQWSLNQKSCFKAQAGKGGTTIISQSNPTKTIRQPFGLPAKPHKEATKKGARF